MVAFVGGHQLVNTGHQPPDLDAPRMDFVNRIVSGTDAALVNPKLAFVGCAIAFAAAVAGTEFDHQARRLQFLPHHIRAAKLSRRHRRHIRHIEPIRSETAAQRRIGVPPVDAGILTDGKLTVRMQLLQHRPQRLRQ
jgi:hypothetical protein